jgi:hypothetical protein
MSPLFGKSDEKAAQEDAAKADVDRLVALPAPELAPVLMPAFGSDGPRGRGPNHGINLLQIMAFLVDPIPRGTKYMRQLEQPVREGLQVLENTGLVVRTSRQNATWFTCTRLGETALADGTIQQRIQDHG